MDSRVEVGLVVSDNNSVGMWRDRAFDIGVDRDTWPQRAVFVRVPDVAGVGSAFHGVRRGVIDEGLLGSGVTPPADRAQRRMRILPEAVAR